MFVAEELNRLLACDPELRIVESPVFADEPKIGVFSAKRAEGGGRTGWGIDPDREKARLKAAAEALERACLTPPDDGRLRHARFGELTGQTDPAEFQVGPAAADRLRRTPRLWAPAKRLHDGAAVLLPAEAAYFGVAAKTEAPIRPWALSTGAALGETGTGQAFARGLLEAIERDSFVRGWYDGPAPARIGGPFGELDALLGELRRYRLDAALFDLGRKLGPPSVLAITLDRSGVGPAVTAGIAARESYQEACRSAVLESVGYRRGIRLSMAQGTWPEAGPPEGIVSITTRAAFWTPLCRIELLPGWVFADPSVRFHRLADIRCDHRPALEALKKRGYNVYHCDLTTPALAARGFEVARAVVPRLRPLSMDEAAFRVTDRGGDRPPHPFI